jgi:hypothetical protein
VSGEKWKLINRVAFFTNASASAVVPNQAAKVILPAIDIQKLPPIIVAISFSIVAPPNMKWIELNVISFSFYSPYSIP